MMRHLAPTVLGLVTLVVIPGIAIGQPTAPPAGQTDPVLTRGATLYRIHCASCHGSKGRGDGPVASALRTKPPDLTSLAQRADGKFPEERVRSTIDGRTDIRAHGGREMPVWGLSFADPGRDASQEGEVDAEIGALVRYLASLQRLSPSTAGAP
ncbi:MAG TPA: c-type cytochrome [Thermoanaerobaculia bacterium]|jgi:mono/diheme cytochrome c family protein|nr:c-type cytochrome [Thermoanaerobaculia bacterium]